MQDSYTPLSQLQVCKALTESVGLADTLGKLLLTAKKIIDGLLSLLASGNPYITV